MPEIRVLAVRQPWANLIVEGLKTIEVRSRPTNIRERVAIYGSSYNPTISEQDWFLYTVKRFEDRNILTTEQKRIADDCLWRMYSRGWIVGTVELIGCEQINPSEIESRRHEHFAYDVGLNHYYWKLANPLKFEKPIRYTPPKGAIIWSKTELSEA